MSFSTELREQNANRSDLVQNHVKSFNFLFANKETGSPGCLDKVIEYLPTYEIDSPYVPDGPVWRFRMKSISVQKPSKQGSMLDTTLFPAEVGTLSLLHSSLPFAFTLCFIGNNQFRFMTHQSTIHVNDCHSVLFSFWLYSVSTTQDLLCRALACHPAVGEHGGWRGERSRVWH